METELKLHVSANDLGRMREHPLLTEHAVDTPREYDFLDVYYDTPGLDLWKNGLTLRVREDRGSWLQIARTASGSYPGLHERGEWEALLPAEHPQPALLARQIKQERLAGLLASKEITEQLRPVFRNNLHRTTWDIKMPDGDELECALEIGKIVCGERQASIAELELELRNGSPAQLFSLALALHQTVPVQLAHDSKAARGYALLSAEPASAVKAATVPLKGRLTLEEAFRRIGLNCLRQMETNIGGVLKKDAESLHQMRVGLRRLRALLDMFAELAPPSPELQGEVDWLAAALGEARDWDVLAGSTLDRISGIDTAALREASIERAGKLHKQMQHTLYTPRFTQLLLRLSGWFLGRQWRDEAGLARDSPLAAPASKAALPLLRKAERRLRKRIAALDASDAPARHRVRIAAKKARYGAEFFRDLLPSKSVKHYITQLSELQDRLGLLNDMAVAGRLLAELEPGEGETAREAAFARGYVLAASEAGSQRLGKALERVGRLRLRR
jgi:triphosphatase